MSLFLTEESFEKYFKQQEPKEIFERGRSIVSINIISTNPIMSCIYVGKNCFFAAKYNRQLGIFSDGLFIQNKEISELYIETKLTSDILVVIGKELLPNGKPLTLRMKLPKLIATKWHHQNLINLKNEIKLKKM